MNTITPMAGDEGILLLTYRISVSIATGWHRHQEVEQTENLWLAPGKLRKTNARSIFSKSD